MKTKQPQDRRKFLLAAGVGSAGAAAIAVGVKGVKAPDAAADVPGTQDGYRATEHILKYYETTKV